MKRCRLIIYLIILFVSCGGSDGGQYVDEIQLFAESNNLTNEWSTWMANNMNTYRQAYLRGRSDQSVRVEVVYDQPINYDPPWESEDEHMLALKNLAELQFPGWEFTFSLKDPSADVTAVLGYTGSASYADTFNQTIYLISEGIFAHEFAHTLGIGHHYCYDENDVTNCGSLPPEEGPCIMNRDSVSWGPTEQFLLMLTGERFDDEINEAMINILSRYPKD